MTRKESDEMKMNEKEANNSLGAEPGTDSQKDSVEAKQEEMEVSGSEITNYENLMDEETAWALFHERLDKLMRTTAMAKVGNGVCILSDDEDGENYQQMSCAGFRAKFLDLVVEYRDATGKKKSLHPAMAWLRDEDKMYYKRIDYCPDGERNGVLNLFQGWGVEPTGGGSCDLFLAHIHDNVCDGNEKHYTFMMDWMADIFQNPGRKHNTAVVLQGVQGTGKSFFVEKLGELVGENNFCTISSTTQLAGKFNSHLSGKMLIFSDEALPSSCLHESGRIKSLISDESLTIEPKGRDAYQVRNLARVIFASNNDIVIPAGNNERRYFVLKMSSQRANDTDYFEKIQDELDAGGYGALMRTLLSREIKSNLRDCPKTEHLHEQMRLQQDPTQAWFLEKLEGGEIHGDIPLDALYERYQKDMKELGIRVKNKSWLSRVATKLFPHAKNHHPYVNVGGKRKRVNTYPFGSLEQCVKSFKLTTGIEVCKVGGTRFEEDVA